MVTSVGMPFFKPENEQILLYTAHALLRPPLRLLTPLFCQTVTIFVPDFASTWHCDRALLPHGGFQKFTIVERPSPVAITKLLLEQPLMAHALET